MKYNEMLTTPDEMEDHAPERLCGVTEFIGQPYAECEPKLRSFDWDGWYPAVINGIFSGIVPADASDEWTLDEDLDAMVPADEANEKKTYYILRDFDGYGSEYPVCVDRAEAERLVRAWDKEDFDEIWREATEEEIAKYGRYDTDTDDETPCAIRDMTDEQLAKYDSSCIEYAKTLVFYTKKELERYPVKLKPGDTYNHARRNRR